MAHGRIEKCATSFETKYDRQQSKTRSFRRHQHFLFFRSLIDRLLVGNIFRYVQRGSHHWHSIQIRCVVSWKHQTLVLAVMSLDSAQPWKLCWFPCLFFAFVSVVLVKMSPDPSPCCGCGLCNRVSDACSHEYHSRNTMTRKNVSTLLISFFFEFRAFSFRGYLSRFYRKFHNSREEALLVIAVVFDLR